MISYNNSTNVEITPLTASDSKKIHEPQNTKVSGDNKDSKIKSGTKREITASEQHILCAGLFYKLRLKLRRTPDYLKSYMEKNNYTKRKGCVRFGFNKTLQLIDFIRSETPDYVSHISWYSEKRLRRDFVEDIEVIKLFERLDVGSDILIFCSFEDGRGFIHNDFFMFDDE